MALPFGIDARAHDGRALTILAKTIYRELRGEGYNANEIMALASELLGLVAVEVKDRRSPSSEPHLASEPHVVRPETPAPAQT